MSGGLAGYHVAGAVLLGYLFDGIVGDPRWLPHPVRFIGRLIAAGERQLNHGSARRRLAAGGLLALGVVGLTGTVAWGLVAGARLAGPFAADVVTALGVGVLLARRSLAAEAGWSVYAPLRRGDLVGARQAVSQVVGRDTADLSEAEVARAAVETLAENSSDGVIGPLLFALVGGLPGIAVYKAVNTLDSMIGHKNDRYLYFGRVAARLDDVANWLPARVTMLAMVIGARMMRADGRAAWAVALADGPKHDSPNAGWPEAAMAGALGVRLGGRNYYDGEPHQGGLMNEGKPLPTPEQIPAAVSLMQVAAHLVLGGGILLRLLIR